MNVECTFNWCGRPLSRKSRRRKGAGLNLRSGHVESLQTHAVMSGAFLNFLQVLLVALRQARPRGADGMGPTGEPSRRSTPRYSSQRDEFHLTEMTPPAMK